MVVKLFQALSIGDFIMQMYNEVYPYEINNVDTSATKNNQMNRIKLMITNAKKQSAKTKLENNVHNISSSLWTMIKFT